VEEPVKKRRRRPGKGKGKEKEPPRKAGIQPPKRINEAFSKTVSKGNGDHDDGGDGDYGEEEEEEEEEEEGGKDSEYKKDPRHQSMNEALEKTRQKASKGSTVADVDDDVTVPCHDARWPKVRLD
jgi:hypothetical protein